MTTMLIDMIWYDIWYDMMWCDVIWYGMVWYDMIWYDIWYVMIYDMVWCMKWYIWYMIWYDVWNGMIYLLNAIGLTPSGSSTVHIYTQTVHRTAQLIREECGPCPVFPSFTLAFGLQLRKKHWKTSVRVAEECQLAQWTQNIQNRTYITIRIYKHNNQNT